MALYTGPWRTSIFLAVTATLGGVIVGLALVPGASGSLRIGLIVAGLLWSAFFAAALGREIARHWRDMDQDE